MVYPVDPVCWQRHCSEGDEPQTLILKLISMKDSKHERAQDGMKPVMSGESLNPEEVVAFANVDVVVAVAVGVGIALAVGMATARAILIMMAHSNSSPFAGLAAILRGMNIYLLFDKDPI